MENYHSTTSSRSDIIVSTRSSNVVSAGFSGDMMADCIDKNLSIMTTENARDVISSSKELVYLFRDQQNYTNYMITKADVIARTIATQFAVVRSVHLSNRSSDTETNQLLRALTNFGTFVSCFFNNLMSFVCIRYVLVCASKRRCQTHFAFIVTLAPE